MELVRADNLKCYHYLFALCAQKNIYQDCIQLILSLKQERVCSLKDRLGGGHIL